MSQSQTTESRRLLALARTAPGRLMLSVEEPSGKWAHYTARELADRVTATAWLALDSGWMPGRHTAIALPYGEGLIRAVLASWMIGSSPIILPPGVTDAEQRALRAGLGPAFMDAFPLGEWALTAALKHVPLSSEELVPAPEPDLTWYLPTGGATVPPRLDPVVPGPGKVLSGVRELMRAAGWHRDAVQLSAGPLSHALPLMTCLAGITGGGHVVLPHSHQPASLRSAVERFRPSWCQLTPQMVGELFMTGTWPQALDSLGIRPLRCRGDGFFSAGNAGRADRECCLCLTAAWTMSS